MPELIGSFHLPVRSKSGRFLYYFSVYVNLSKNNFSKQTQNLLRKRVQRYNKISYAPNIFGKLFHFFHDKAAKLI